jgi:SAM-dependent methyltransferase
MDSSPDAADERALRASSFGRHAAAYAAERPGYPGAAIGWALRPVAGRTPLRVLDLGAGTGKLTDGVLRHTDDVVAVEPDPGMLAELRRALPGVRALEGAAEEIPLGDESVDAIVVGQALHWFDLDRAFPEMWRVLAPGGLLAGLWNLEDDREPWVKGFKEVSDSRVSFSEWKETPQLTPSPHFPHLEHELFPHTQRRTAESMVANLATHSHVLIMAEDERRELLHRARAYLRDTPATRNGEFDLPMLTMSVRGLKAASVP